MGGPRMKKLGTFVAIGMGVVFVSASAYGQLGIPAKLKASKVQGNLVPSYHPLDTGAGTGDDENDSPAFLDTAVQSGNCMFTQGKFKAQVGKDAAVQLKGVVCGGVPADGIMLCAHTKDLSTIMNEDIDKTGATAAKTCLSGTTHLEGKVNFSTGNFGSLTCVAGTCKGTLAVVATDPCPDVDKVAEVRRLEVFDGNDSAVIPVMGTNLSACCGSTQTVVGPVAASSVAPCNTSTQQVMAEIGTVTQGVTP
jgi:hypothetical protein